ncbi:MAG: lipoyl synthase [Proteobacteria bacterium]|nr:MAG: lipoyl synthase [Pseudomonadota bacterium]
MSENLPKNRKPEWLKVRAPGGENYLNLKQMMRERRLATVCEEAHCPNIGECWGGGTATIMVMGDTCTRGCRFCNVKTAKFPGALDPDEPVNVARSLKDMRIDYVVVTTVDRDDLADQGAEHFAEIIRQVKKENPRLRIETLAGDFQGNQTHLKTLLDSDGIDVFAHNIETVERLTPKVRDRRATYRQTLDVLRNAKKIRPQVVTKTSIMVGLGETREEVIQTMQDCFDAGVEIITLGQYLQPSSWHLTVAEFVHPDQFKEYEKLGLQMGFRYVASGPLVRSSYRAGEFFIQAFLNEKLQNDKVGE